MRLIAQLEEAQRIAKIGSWNWDLLTNDLYWSEEHYRIFEIESPQPQDALFKMYLERILPEDRDKMDALMKKTLEEGAPFVFEHRLKLPSGQRKYVRGVGTVTRNAEGRAVAMAGTCQDLTEIKETSFRLEQIAANIQEVFWMTNAQKNRMEYVSPGYQTVWGRTVESLYENPLSFVEAIHPDDRARVVAAFSRQIKGDYLETYRILRPSGEVRWIRDRAYPVASPSGEMDRVVGLAQDITAEVESAEALNAERAKSAQNAKLASLGELSAGIAHEINNPLAVIVGCLDLLQRPNQDPTKIAPKLEKIRRSTERIVKIVSGLRKFARVSSDVSHSAHGLSELVSESLLLVDAKIRRLEVKVDVDFSAPLEILCDEVEIEQVIVNLLSNSLDAIQALPVRWIRVVARQVDHEVVLRVIDSGPGIPIDIEKKLFDPFFTTKSVGEGTGLGLSISKGILDQHHAKISVDRTCPNTCFEIRFPAVTK